MSTQLNDYESRLWFALEKIGDNVWEYDFETAETTFSKKITEDLTIPASASANDEGKAWWHSVHPDDIEILRKTYHNYKYNLIDSHSLEYRVLTAAGEIWLLDRGLVIERDENGLPLKLIGTHTNITKNKHTEIELSQRVSQFRSLAENIPAVIYEFELRANGDEIIRYISPAVERIFGISCEEFPDYTNFLPPTDRVSIQQKKQHSYNTLEPFDHEAIISVPGKMPRWHALHVSYSYTLDDETKVFTGFLKDINDRKNAEAILRSNEEKYRSIIANMNLGLLEVDNNGIITYANQGFSQLSGYTIPELMGKEALSLVIEEEYQKRITTKTDARKQGLADAYEVKALNKSGESRWWLISGAPRYNDKGEMVGSIGIHLDITDHKIQEEELIKAKIEAENLAKTKEIFLANMSHEIRTPMNAIIGMSNQLAKTDLVPQQSFYLDTILSASDNLLVIINDILDLSKIEAGKLSIENIGFEPKVVLKQVMQVLGLKAEEKGIKLSNTAFDNGIAQVLMGDPHRLNQILLNLIGNSIKFTDKGSVQIEMLLTSGRKDYQTVKFVVRDTGVGMDESFVEHLFDKFSQEHESVARKFGGTGLGMSICKQLVELMGGKIEASSQKGSGTTISFIIEFKTGTSVDLPSKNDFVISKNFLAGCNVLVTDDNAFNRLVASTILQNYGAKVSEAADGEEAIKILTASNFDIVLMDVQMPALNGLEATRILRLGGETTPILALTAGAVKGEREKCIDAGMNDYISKPFKENDFLKVIDRWVPKNVIAANKVSKNIDIEALGLYNLNELRTVSKGNEEFVKKMCTIFCEQASNLVADLNQAFQNNELVKMGEIAHKIKPSINSLNIDVLKDIIKNIEKKGRENVNDAELADNLKYTGEILKKVISSIKQEISI